jgi:hypothetical protein
MIPAVPDDDDDDLEAELSRKKCASLLFNDDDPRELISRFPIIASFLWS